MPRFPKTAKLTKPSEFNYLLNKGIYFGDSYFGIRWKKWGVKRLGIAVSRKIGKAAKRNQIKRVVRECFRLHPERFPSGDVIVIAKKGLDALNKSAVRKRLFKLLEKNG